VGRLYAEESGVALPGRNRINIDPEAFTLEEIRVPLHYDVVQGIYFLAEEAERVWQALSIPRPGVDSAMEIGIEESWETSILAALPARWRNAGRRWLA
jgi:hypothetical protein